MFCQGQGATESEALFACATVDDDQDVEFLSE